MRTWLCRARFPCYTSQGRYPPGSLWAPGEQIGCCLLPGTPLNTHAPCSPLGTCIPASATRPIIPPNPLT